MDKDEGGSVVGDKSNKHIDPDRGDVPGSETHDRKDKSIKDNHANAKTKNKSANSYLCSGIEVILFLIPGQNFIFVLHIFSLIKINEHIY